MNQHDVDELREWAQSVREAGNAWAERVQQERTPKGFPASDIWPHIDALIDQANFIANPNPRTRKPCPVDGKPCRCDGRYLCLEYALAGMTEGDKKANETIRRKP